MVETKPLKALISPAAGCGKAAWANADMAILAPRSLIQRANHFKGTQVLSCPVVRLRDDAGALPDLAEIKDQGSAGDRDCRQAQPASKINTRPHLNEFALSS
ncbi:hypothetical protein [Roseibium sp.]|uniref:hypothetical protein n=1 Tax=Roseibium sp. TaxID=1936156 RepID=UPI003518DF1B